MCFVLVSCQQKFYPRKIFFISPIEDNPARLVWLQGSKNCSIFAHEI